jgi:hypothetical protein
MNDSYKVPEVAIMLNNCAEQLAISFEREI